MEIKFRDIIIVILVLVGFVVFWPSYEEVVEDSQEQEHIEQRLSPSQSAVVRQEPKSQSPQTQPRPVLPAIKTSQSPQAQYPNLDESFVPFDEKGERYIEQVIKVGNNLVYHGDVLLGKAEDLPKILKNKVIKKGKARKWPGGLVPYVIDDNVVQVDKVLEAIEYINTFTNVKIIPRESQEDYVLITLGESDCYSYAGRVGGRQEMYLVPQCGVREIIHEWMHSLGFFHEQNREDRDQYLQILWDNIAEVNRPQFKKLPNDFIGLVGRPFDYQSIMLYSSETFSQYPGEPALLTKEGEFIPHSQNLLSPEDIKRVNRAYPSVQ